MSYPTSNEQTTMLRQAYAVDGVPDDAIRSWFDRNILDLAVHARRGAVMALPLDAKVPAWASVEGKPWPALGYRLLAPLCDAAGERRSVVAHGVLASAKHTAVPEGLSHAGLVLTCPTGRRMLMGQYRPKRLLVAADFLSWIRLVQGASTPNDGSAVWGLLPNSWQDSIEARISAGLEVIFTEGFLPEHQARLDHAKASFERRAANENKELPTQAKMKESA